MRIRSHLHLDGEDTTLQLYPILEETDDHLLLKLAAFVLYHREKPHVISSPEQFPALEGQEFGPDLVQANLTHEITLWIECGKTTLHKLGKATKRHRDARIIMLMALPLEARQMKEALMKEDLDRIEVWNFPEGDYKRWKALVSDQNDIIGEANEHSMNLVVNGQVFMTDLQRQN